MSIGKFSVDNAILVNMVMIVVFIVGIFTAYDIPKEEMPAVDMGSFVVVVAYMGVSPSEMEQLVVKKLEDEVADVDDIDFVQSTCQEGRATIFIQMLPDADLDQAWNDINTELDKVNDLPEDASDPMVIRINMREVNEICNIALGGEFSDNSIREIAEDLRDELLNVDYISKVDMAGVRQREIWVEGNSKKLDQYGLTLDDLVNVISARNMNVPGGTIKFGRAEFIVRTMGEFETTDDIAELIVRMDSNGRTVRVKHVAAVKDTLEEAETLSKLNGEPAVNLYLYKKAEGNIIAVMKDVRAKAKEFEERISGLKAEVRSDGSIEVRDSIQTLTSNALLGILLVFIILTIFLGFKNALLAAWGIPFSFLLAFFLMRQLDITMNNLSLFALILVLGMIVDDAIIVLENIHRNREEGLPLKEAVIKGTSEITWPVVAAIATTVAAFLPLLMMSGMMGKFMRLFPIVVSLALLASLFESLIILPAHVYEFSGNKNAKKKKKKASQNKLTEFLIVRYRKAVTWALRHRFITIFMVVIALFASLAAVAVGLVKFEFFPQGAPKTIILNMETPTGTNLDETNEVVSKVEDYIFSMKESVDIEAVVSTVGQYVENHQFKVKTSNAEIKIDLLDADDLTYDYQQTQESIRSYLDQLPGVYTYKFDMERHGPPTGGDIDIRVIGDDLHRLEYIGNYIVSELQKIPGTADLETSFEAGKKEIRIVPKHDKLGLYGLTVRNISNLVNTASYGRKVSEYRGTGLEEYDIIVRTQENQIDDISDLENLKIRTMTGDLIALKEVANFIITQGYSQITHWDKKRLINITGSTSFYKDANGNPKKQTPDEVTSILQGNKLRGQKGVLSDFETKFPGYSIEYGGIAEERAKSFNSLYVAFGVAIVLVFSILAAQFKSYVQPLIVMMTIPFGAIGVIFGLMVTGLPFSLMTLISVVALAGVVVNDSLVLVDFVNKEREAGIDRWNSLIDAGAKRLRPILLTTITTIGGFMPMILSTSSATRDWKPMAVSIAFGLGFATILTLFVIPVIYSLVDSLFGKLNMTRFKTHISLEEALNCKKDNTCDELLEGRD